MSVCRTNFIHLSLAVTTCFGEHSCTHWLVSWDVQPLTEYVWNIPYAPGRICLSRNGMVSNQTLFTQQETGIQPIIVILHVQLPSPDTGAGVFTSVLFLVAEMMLRLANGFKNCK